ncbi:MAG TPA: D-glycero-beta-D-manno-heptose 1,7-bisphosphate 7-phosphatase [Coxiellaceae bacterium]|nr:D-glycero-beta-D-manno-heptose 1,7-bisphosphate 7-phosphatase [Coxiellaceae bacterium]
MLIILDRDGVINFESDAYIKSPEEWIPIPGSIDAIAKLTKAGYKIVIATNQAGVGRGLYTLATLQKIHDKMLALIENAGGKIEKIYICPHHPDENCNCRKPKPGLLQQIHDDFQIDYKDMLFVGDSERDYQAAKTVGCLFVLLKTGNGKKALQSLNAQINRVYEDLAKFAESVSESVSGSGSGSV